MSSLKELDEYMQTGKYKDGLSRCNKLLKKSPTNIDLLTFKARFLRSLDRDDEAQAAITSLMAQISYPASNATLASVESLQWQPLRFTHPRPLTVGSDVNTMWTSAAAALPKQKAIELHQVRFNIAIEDGRWIDAGYALSNWRKADPNNKTLRSLHVAVYQLIADNVATDPKTAMMNSMLAVRTMDQIADSSVNEADLLLFCQICKRQNQQQNITKRLKTIVDSPQCTWSLLREYRNAAAAQEDWPEVKRIMSLFLLSENEPTADHQAGLCDLTRNDWASWQAFLRAQHQLGETSDPVPMPQDNKRYHDLAGLWIVKDLNHPEILGDALGSYWGNHGNTAFCFDDMKDFVLSMSVGAQMQFRRDCLEAAEPLEQMPHDRTIFWKWIIAEVNALRFEYLLTVGQWEDPDPAYLREFVSNAIRLHELARDQGYQAIATLGTLLCAAWMRWHQVDPSGGHLLEATVLMEWYATNHIYQAQVLLVCLYTELGLYSKAMLWYENLSIKELQHETFSHVLLPRISVGRPFASSAKKLAYGDASELLKSALAMYPKNLNNLATFSKSIVDNGRSDMLLDLQDLRQSLDQSITRKILLLEQRKVQRFTGRAPQKPLEQTVYQRWQNDLKDNRDYKTTANAEAGDAYLDVKFWTAKYAPNEKWILYNLWIEETWSWLQNTQGLVKPLVLENRQALRAISGDPCLVITEQALVGSWEALGVATALGAAAESATAPSQKLDPEFALFVNQLEGSLSSLLNKEILAETLVDFKEMPTSWRIQSFYLWLDYLRALNLFLKTFSKAPATKSLLPKSRVEPLLTRVQDMFNNVRKHATEERAKVDYASTLHFLENGVLGSSCDGVLSEHAHSVCDSATDTWDGVLKVVLDAPRY